MISKLRIYFWFIFILFACKKASNGHPVPSIAFDITIDLNLPTYLNLQGVGGWAYINGGSRGIIAYRRSADEIVAFDRHSPKDPDGICPLPLYPLTTNFLQLKDSCNNALFSLNDGSPIRNSEYGLRQYQTQFNGTNQLRIYN
jgi:hypothetical protein